MELNTVVAIGLVVFIVGALIFLKISLLFQKLAFYRYVRIITNL